MANKRTQSIIRFLPSLTDLVFLMPIVFLFARMEGAKTMLGDGDTGWHIRTGEWIMANGRVPHNDVFSFTKAGDPWYAWEWLWEVCFAWIYHLGGLAAVVVGSMVVICLTFSLLFRLVRKHCDNPFLAVAVTFLACAASSLHWLARPHLFTMLFVVILLFILDWVREGQTRMLLVLPALTVLWTNLHGGFLVEFIILAGCIAGEAVRAIFAADPGERGTALRSAKRYIGTACACAAATLVNPYTYHLHVHIWRYFSEPYHIQNIAEYQSISFHAGVALYLELMLLLAAISGVWFVVRRRDFVPLILIAGWGHLALFAARNVPLFVIIAAPFVAQACSEMLHSLEQAHVSAWLHRLLAGLKRAGAEFGETDGLWRTHLVSVAGVVVIAGLLLNPNAQGKLKPEYDPTKYPATALTVLRALPDARIFADDEWGDYLIYQLYPQHKVFVDGRSDFYGQDFEQKYFDLITAKYGWEQYLRKYNIDTIVLSPDTALSTAIKESRNWRVIYDDTVAVVFTAVQQPSPESNQFSAAKWGGKNHNPVLTKRTPSEHGTTADKHSKGV